MRHTKDPEIDEQVRLFGASMRTARTEYGLSQVALSAATGLDRAAISFLERAERSPDLSTLVRVARALGTTPAAMLEGIGSGTADFEQPSYRGVARAPEARLGANLRAARHQAGLSQETLGFEAEVDRAAISVYERGGRGPNLRTVLKLCRALDLRPSVLLAGVE
ncbi:MAG TPA: helix-turn-helix transcriptional regulator [Solirubrobacteraceae bacterium]|nr:helix-turn-helix transcriptional regulator [Solirubrobacteraceae bacterium]